MACTATCGSSAHAWTHEVAVAAGGVEVVGREVGQLDQRPRAAGRPGRTGPARVPSGAGVPTNIDRPNPNVIVRPAGGRSAASPVSSGGASYGPDAGPSGPAGRPCVSRAAIVVHRRSSATSSSRDVVVRSNAAKYRRSCAGVTMPAWCAPVNGYVPAAVAAAGGGVAAVARPTPRPAATPATAMPPPRPSRARRDSPPGPRRASRGLADMVRRRSTVAVSRESGSERASTAAASSLTWASVSSVVVREAGLERALLGQQGVDLRRTAWPASSARSGSSASTTSASTS